MSFACTRCNQEVELSDACELPCSCMFCKPCMIDYVEDTIQPKISSCQDHGHLQVPCMGCATTLYHFHLQALDPDKFKEWEAAATAAVLRAQGMSQCPYPDCQAWIELIDKSGVQRNSQTGGVLGKRPHSVPTPSQRAGPSSHDVIVIGDSDDESDKMNAEQATQQHYDEHRYRCGLCKRDFCASCSTRPYHKGFTCQQYRAPKCTSCGARVLHRGVLACADPGPRLMRQELVRADVCISWCIERGDFQQVYNRLRGICSTSECREKLSRTCTKQHLCGHVCHGMRNESPCLRCIEPSCTARPSIASSSSSAPPLPHPTDSCFFCWETLPSAPCLQLTCGHICHASCARERLKAGFPGPGISFQFLYCPLCGTGQGAGAAGQQLSTGPVHLDHPALQRQLKPHLELRQKVVDLAKLRLKIELKVSEEEDLQPGGKFEGRPADFALSRFLFYKCSKCSRPYFGGQRQCGDNNQQDNNQGQQFDANELMCGECSAVAHGSACPHHGNKYIEWKCRYCCSVASWFCFGTTHFCNPCHSQAHGIQAKACTPATCTLKMAHPQPGTEFCMGCGLCRRADEM